MIDGVKIVPLRQIVDERGKIMHMLKATDPHFITFGEIYFSTAWPGTVKAWHIHQTMTVNNAVISGRAKLVLYDIRDGSPTKGTVNEFFMGEKNPILITIPPKVWHGMKGIGTEPAMLVNCPTEPYNYKDPDEVRCDPHQNDIPYDWDRKDG